MKRSETDLVWIPKSLKDSTLSRSLKACLSSKTKIRLCLTSHGILWTQIRRSIVSRIFKFRWWPGLQLFLHLWIWFSIWWTKRLICRKKWSGLCGSMTSLGVSKSCLVSSWRPQTIELLRLFLSLIWKVFSYSMCLQLFPRWSPCSRTLK